MKINFTRGILLGVGLLSATTLIGASAPAEAQPNHRRDGKIVRRDVKVVRRTVIRDQFPNRNTTLEGRVVNDLKNNGVILRPTRGDNIRVTFSGGEPRRIDKGDLIRVTGYRSGATFVARSVTILRNR